MALGGGTFVFQNKTLPGSYINFVSAAAASASLSERGVAAMGFGLGWGPEDRVFVIEGASFAKEAPALLGRQAVDEALWPVREVLCGAHKVYAWRLDAGGARAACRLAEAKYAGVRGNALALRVAEGEGGGFAVSTLLDGEVVDRQEAATMEELLDNDWLVWNRGEALEATAGMPLAGGTNGAESAAQHAALLAKAESLAFNALGCASGEAAVKRMYADFTRRMRDEQGVKFQLAVAGERADHEGVVDVLNGAVGVPAGAMAYWVCGALAGCEVNQSLTNRRYDGELEVQAELGQSTLEAAVAGGQFAFHRVGDEVRVLRDISSLVNLTADKGRLFQSNQVVRVADQIGNDLAVLFNSKYLGVVPNDADGRIALWSDIVKHHEQLARVRAIEAFASDHVNVEVGEDKRSVVVYDSVRPVGCMEQLYMTCVVQ